MSSNKHKIEPTLAINKPVHKFDLSIKEKREKEEKFIDNDGNINL